MELTVIGSGTGVPSPRRGAPSLLLKVNGKNLLVDIGSGTLQKLLLLGLNYHDPDVIFLTHLHPDHISDLLPFLFACKYSLSPRTKDLYIIGGRGFREFYEGMKSLYGHWVKGETYRLHVQEAPSGRRSLLGFEFVTLPLDHTRSSIGIRIEAEGKSIVFSGDTDYCPEIVELSKGADLLVLECSFPNYRKVKGHLTPALATEIAKEANVKKLLLTHFYPPCDEVDILEECGKGFEGEVILAEDMMKLFL